MGRAKLRVKKGDTVVVLTEGGGGRQGGSAGEGGCQKKRTGHEML